MFLKVFECVGICLKVSVAVSAGINRSSERNQLSRVDIKDTEEVGRCRDVLPVFNFAPKIERENGKEVPGVIKRTEEPPVIQLNQFLDLDGDGVQRLWREQVNR